MCTTIVYVTDMVNKHAGKTVKARHVMILYTKAR